MPPRPPSSPKDPPDDAAPLDVAVIGAGPGGYVAAIRCAQLGLRTACIDKWTDPRGRPALGGTCLNVGCIPSKALLDSSHHFDRLSHLLPEHGISVEGARIDVAAMQARKHRLVASLGRGVAGLLRKNGVELVPGAARLTADGAVEVTGSPPRSLRPRHVVLAAGSVPAAIEAAPTDGARIVDSEGALAFGETPRRLAVIGAGVIGLELGSVWRRLGSEVVLLEALDDFLPAADRDVAKQSLRIFRRQGLDVRLGQRVTGCDPGDESVAVHFEDSRGAHRIEAERVVVSVGRRPATEGLGLEEAGVERDERGFVRVDGFGRTSRENVWAVGDCAPGPMLAHRAAEDGVAVAERIAGQASRIDHRTVPWVIYTHPEIAWAGRTEAELDEAGVEWRSGTFPFAASGRALAAGRHGGVRQGARRRDDRRDPRRPRAGRAGVGAHRRGGDGHELQASAEDLARTVHAHPTLAEGIPEAALAVDERAIHL